MENILEHTALVAEIEEPNLGYEANEFVIRRDEATGIWYAGSDGGCSCYDGFNPANFSRYTDIGDLRLAFGAWVGGWWDGAGHEAAGWEQFHTAVRSVL